MCEKESQRANIQRVDLSFFAISNKYANNKSKNQVAFFLILLTGCDPNTFLFHIFSTSIFIYFKLEETESITDTYYFLY